LAERTEDPVEAILIPKYEFMAEKGPRAELQIQGSSLMLSAGAGGSEEESNEA
jgi:hypothetical protein